MKINPMVSWLAGLATILVTSAALASDLAPIATPEGITLEPLGQAQGYDLGKETASILLRDQIVLADPRGMTLYTYAQDPPHTSRCVAACTATWQPLIAPAHANTYGDWSVIRRPDGARQWAYKSKPLYTYVKDLDPGSVGGNDPARFGARRKNSAGQYVGGGNRGSLREGTSDVTPLPADWKPALLYPVTEEVLPAGMSVREVPDAEGLVLTDYRGRTLYAFKGDPAKDTAACASVPCPWQPVAAPEAAGPVGDFAVVVRQKEGINQWTYKGEGLYSYAGDLAVGDAYGIGITPKWHVAAVVRYYMPPSVTLVNTPGQGKILASADGRTLYRRDAYILQSGGGHSFRRGNPARPAVGRDIGVNAQCEGQCARMWHPFLAPANAQPRGFWNLAQRSDSPRQWTYQGFALWIYDGDKKPGDMNGNDNLQYQFEDEASTPRTTLRQALDIGTPQDGPPGLYWAIAVP
jgi:predicted lipoprotein with Yx(FWY)xxD motif